MVEEPLVLGRDDGVAHHLRDVLGVTGLRRVRGGMEANWVPSSASSSTERCVRDEVLVEVDRGGEQPPDERRGAREQGQHEDEHDPGGATAPAATAGGPGEAGAAHGRGRARRTDRTDWTRGRHVGKGTSVPLDRVLPSRVRVLVVDDTAHVRRVVVETLELDGYDVVGQAEDGDRAVEEAVRLQPHLVVMDLRMPGTDGLEATRRIRAVLPAVQVVLYTAYLDPVVRAQAADAGAALCLAKVEGLPRLGRELARLTLAVPRTG